MRAVLATPPGPEQDHLYPHPDDSHPDDSAQGSDAPVGARVVGPGATDSLACRAPGGAPPRSCCPRSTGTPTSIPGIDGRVRMVRVEIGR